MAKKTNETVVEVVAATEEVKETKTTAKKAPAKKAAAKTDSAAKETKAAAKKPAAKKTTAKVEKVVETYVEFAGNQVLLSNVEASVKAAYVAEGHRESSIKTMKVYVKPEENAAYYVINDNNVGRVDLFA
jgi:hypothetical protein